MTYSCIFLLKHVGVKANVVDVRTGLEQTTNDFRFTWCKDVGDSVPRKVVPKTYQGKIFCEILVKLPESWTLNALCIFL
jgi:hypothetical protein